MNNKQVYHRGINRQQQNTCHTLTSMFQYQQTRSDNKQHRHEEHGHEPGLMSRRNTGQHGRHGIVMVMVNEIQLSPPRIPSYEYQTSINGHQETMSNIAYQYHWHDGINSKQNEWHNANNVINVDEQCITGRRSSRQNNGNVGEFVVSTVTGRYRLAPSTD